MEKYSEEDITKLISDCEILILPDNMTLEDAREDLANIEVENRDIKAETKTAQEAIDEFDLETEEDFERIYDNSVATRHSVTVSIFYLM